MASEVHTIQDDYGEDVGTVLKVRTVRNYIRSGEQELVGFTRRRPLIIIMKLYYYFITPICS